MTLAQLLDRFIDISRATQTQKQAAKTAVTHFARALDKPPDEIPVEELHNRPLDRLRDFLAGGAGVSSRPKGLIANNRSALKRLIRFAQDHKHLKRTDVALSPAWAALLNLKGIPRQTRPYAQMTYTRTFGRFCTERGIEPDDLTSETFQQYLEYLPTSGHYGNWKQAYWALGRTFHDLLKDRFPNLEFPSLANGERTPYRLLIRQWPDQLHSDWVKYDLWAKQVIIDPKRPKRKKLRQITIDTYLQDVEYLLGYLVHVRHMDIEEFRFKELLDCEEEGYIVDFINWCISERHNGKITEGTKRKVDSFYSIAHNYFQLEPHNRADYWLFILRSQVYEGCISDPMKKAHPFTRKEIKKIALYFDDVLEKWMKNPKRQQKPKDSHQVSMAVNRRNALLFRMWPDRPYRARNIREMQWGKNLFQDAAGDWMLCFTGEEMKIEVRSHQGNMVDFVWPMDMVQELEEYRSKWWPILVREHPECRSVFPTVDGNQMTYDNLYETCKEFTRRVLGRAISPHRIRDSFASDCDGTNLLEVQILLNHAHFSTTQKSYMSMNTQRISRQYDLKRMSQEERYTYQIKVLTSKGLSQKDAEDALAKMEGAGTGRAA